MLADQRVCWHVAGNACKHLGVGVFFGVQGGLYVSGCQVQEVLAGCVGGAGWPAGCGFNRLVCRLGRGTGLPAPNLGVRGWSGIVLALSHESLDFPLTDPREPRFFFVTDP